MNRQNILVSACCLAAVSLGGNIWLLMHKNEKPVSAPHQEKAPPALPTAAEFDFSDTAFADGSWKLSDNDEKPSVSIDRPFNFEEFKAPPRLEVPENYSGPPRMRPGKLARDFLDYGDTSPDSPPLKK